MTVIIEEEKSKEIWNRGLTLPGYSCLKESFTVELAEYRKIKPQEVKEKIKDTKKKSIKFWQDQEHKNEKSINTFYNDCPDYIYTLASLGDLYRRLIPCMIILHYMQKNNAPNKERNTVLDYGCGIGTLSSFYSSQDFKLTIADISRQFIDFSLWRYEKRQWEVNHINLNKEKLPENAYDYIISFDVFEHLANPWVHLKALSKAVKNDGMIFIVAPFGYDPYDPTHIVKDSRVLDLAPILGLQRVNYRKEINTSDKNLYVFKFRQVWFLGRILAIGIGVIFYFLRYLKNGRNRIGI